MRLNAEAVICTTDKKWYYGSINRIDFYIKEQITSKDYFKNTKRFRTMAEYIKELGYVRHIPDITKTILKRIFVINGDVGSVNVLKIIIGKTVNMRDYDNKDKHILCANCIYDCKVSNEGSIIGCSKFY